MPTPEQQAATAEYRTAELVAATHLATNSMKRFGDGEFCSEIRDRYDDKNNEYGIL